MDERQNELGAVLAEVRRRWTRRVRLGAWSTGALAATMFLGVGGLTVWLLASEGLPLAFVVLVVLALVAVTLAAALRRVRRPPSDLQLARFIEERAGGLDDVVVTAVEHGGSTNVSAPALTRQAVRAVRDIGFDRIVSADVLRRATIGAMAATLVLLAGSAAFAPTASRGLGVAAAYLLPSRLLIEVTPGTSKLRAGSPLTITARIHGLETGLVPELHIGAGDAATATRMNGAGDGQFTVTFDRVQQSFSYSVSAGPARSAEFAIDVIRPARVKRIDLRYRYPDALGLPARVEEDGGDIYGPAGTTVDLTIVTDKPVTTGALTLGDGSRVGLGGSDNTQLTASLPIRADGAYRVALTDVDGLENPGETEYFIRMLDDRPPDVRVMRPGGDKQVTPLEEVQIEVRAEDDFGVANLDLVFQVPGRKDTVVPFPTGRAVTASGQHMIQLESLGVRPGDFVSYYARARDVGQGRQGAEARSDIFFLEVKPFEETFVAAQSQAAGMQGSPQLQELAQAQKEIIAATWKLDARARRAGARQSAQDIKAVAAAQTELRARAAEEAGDVAQALADPRRRRLRPGQSAPGGEDPMARAVAAMGRAAASLDALKTADALPPEMEALEQLLKADSDVKRRQIARQQGSGSGSNRQTPDLSTLFDQQLRKQQQTNYETPNDTESRPESKPEEDALSKIRELARRQEALQRAQRDLARSRDRMSDEEIKRQLERLTREQQQLAEQANELSKQMQQSSRASSESQQRQSSSSRGQSSESRGGQSSQGEDSQNQQSSSIRRLRDISEQMRGATSELRREDPEQASSRSGQAAEQLRDLTRQMERARPEERRRAMGDLQFETRQLADAERRLAGDAEKLSGPGGSDDARRRLAGEQQRLAERAERLQQAARDLSEQSGTPGENDADARQAAGQAARDLERERIAERMRASAEAMRQAETTASQGDTSRELARSLDRIAGQLGQAAGTADRETERLSDQLARAGELREQIGDLQRTIETLEREARQGQQGGRPQSDAAGQRPQQGGSKQSGQSSSPSEGQEGTPSDQSGGTGRSRLSQLQREAADRMREAQRLAGELQQQSPDMRNGVTTPENWYPSLSAPGTEAFKQDFSKWESLKKGLLSALERTETRLSAQLRERESRARLNAGGYEGVASEYQEMVDRYYQSLAAPRKAPR
jgi:hypothetical protein